MRIRHHPSTLLTSIAHDVEEALHPDPRGTIVLLQDDPADREQVVLSLRALEGHPCEDLAGFQAPPGCWALILVTPGRAHLLDAPDEAPVRIVSTYLLHRDGRSVSLLRRGDEVSELPGPAVGRIPDLCSRILGDT